MKRVLITISTFFALILSSVILTSSSHENHVAYSKKLNGAPGGKAGDRASSFTDCTDCHSGSATTVGNMITSNIPASGYVAGTTYSITATIVQTGIVKFGFEISPQSSTGSMRGTLAITSTQTQLKTAFSCSYVTHTSSGNSGSGSKTWSFNWTAPATGLGPVTFYGAFVAADNDGSESGDDIYLSTYAVSENLTTNVDASSPDVNLNVYPNPVTDNIHVNYFLKSSQHITISIMDINGQISEIFFTGIQDAGTNELNIPLHQKYPSGIYFLQIKSNEFIVNKRLIVE